MRLPGSKRQASKKAKVRCRDCRRRFTRKGLQNHRCPGRMP